MAALRLLSTQAARGQLFRQLHLQPDVLVLLSIRALESCVGPPAGSPAVASHDPRRQME
jgi:hypothetical protein